MSEIGVDFSYSDQGLSATAAKLEGFFGTIQKVGSAAAALDFPPLSIGLAGVDGANEAISSMRSALDAAEASVTPFRATLARLEAVLHGTAAVARITKTAISLFPAAFAGLPPAIGKSLSAMSLASRAADALRGRLSPLGSAMAYMEMRNLGLSKSYSALASTVGFATSVVVGSTRRVTEATAKVGSSLARNLASGTGRTLSAVGVGVMGLLGPLAAVGGVAGTTGIAVAGMKKAFDLGGSLSDLNARTGDSIKELLLLQQVMTNAGAGAEAAGPAINRLQKALTGVNDEGEPTNKTFDRLGLSVERLKGLSAVDQMRETGRAINALTDPAERAAAAMGIFGKSGGELLAVFADSGAFADAASDLGSQADILARNAALFDKISDILGTTGVKLRGFFVGMAEQIAPVIEPLLELFRDTDFAGLGQSFGRALALGLQSLIDGSLIGILGASATIAASEVVNFLWRGLSSAVSGAGQLLMSGFGLAVDTVSILGKPDFWKGMGNQLLALAQSFNSLFYSGFAKVVDLLRPIFDKVGLGATIDSISSSLSGTAAATGADAARLQAAAVGSFAPLLADGLRKQNEAAERITQAIVEGFSSAPDLLDISGAQEDLDARIAGVSDRLLKLQADALDKGQGDKRSGALDFAAGGTGKSAPTASRLVAIGGFGVFVKDPLLSESRKQSSLLEKIARNTEKPAESPGPTSTLVFS